MQFPATELVLDANGAVYHLGLQPHQLATKVILVGDQDRVAKISRFFDHTESRVQHREFVSHTGTFQGKRLTVLSTGIGTDNIDICMAELDALVNINLAARAEKQEKTSLEIVRIGTCGMLQSDMPLHSFVLSTHALGLDNIAHFYPIDFSKEEQHLLTQINTQVHFPGGVVPYLSAASSEMVQKLASDRVRKGITVTSSGFYGPQGRSLRLASKMPDIHRALEKFNDNGQQIVNFEMESSAIFALGKALGHRCTSICLGVANRPQEIFSTGIETAMDELITYVLERI
ncbi:MAG: nucleoside phosphorylase [Crocinitomicaceae bacterium]|jgi:uridine phosphorylase|nr:nucleoside phosphorylase [Crocinitomicaceae bacterium]MDP4723080.1 nucleoside phosphorylase [Crocinitomicaceae bacterium]MDP4740267.1 nucleoside phosphorylase [Crocinitomicaceae bacterium]MDP4955029.1 nucleoside phosphorylase [Crocinitomicaceae bacterium]MDP5043240.1 nucleoside phosphorylase [Crocinitomicaceae bacterium]